MKQSKQLHTIKNAKTCLAWFKKHVCPKAVLIGSFGKGVKQSYNDIDIYIPVAQMQKSMLVKLLVQGKIKAKKVERTDCGGWFFHQTTFGNVDVFFDISQFDY